MKNKQTAPFGSWLSEVSAELVAEKGTRLGHMQVFDGKAYWLESRPELKGQGVIVCFDGTQSNVVSPGTFNVGSKVHEYGGGDFLVCQRGLILTQRESQALYCCSFEGELQALTDTAAEGQENRYADFSISPCETLLFAVRERHQDGQVYNELVVFNFANQQLTVIAEGADFYAAPRISPDGKRLAWVQWFHPQMPWDGTELWVADVSTDGSLSAQHQVCGGAEESVVQPQWSHDGCLHFISDRSGWWNLYAFRDGVLNALMPTDNDCALPMWNFGYSTYCLTPDQRVYLVFFEEGQQQLAEIDVETGKVTLLELPFRDYPGQLHFGHDPSGNECLYFIAGSPVQSTAVYCFDIASGKYESVSSDGALPVANDWISLAKPVTFTSATGAAAHAYFYEPINPNYQGENDEKPPLIVMSHGGPTGATTTTLDWAIQYWTSRGFAVVDVNYTGSTGFGRAYRDALRGQWGVSDVNDCVYAARYLVEDELVDGDRLLIRGGSAGGLTTLCALTFTDDFAAGMSRYGVADLEALAGDTHKFEARYLDSLVGPYPESRELYQQRSPIHHAQHLSCPLLVLQGSDDKVVPPSQSEAMVAALAEKDIPHAYIEFAGEGHGFRQRETIISALQAELYFYRKVLSINSEEALPEIKISGF